MRAHWFSDLLFVLLVLTSAQAQKTNLKHVPPPPREAVNQEMYAPYWTLEPGWHTDIELRNNRKSALTVTPSLRTASGTEILLAAVSIPPDEVTVLDLMQALSASHPELIGKTGSYGSIVLRYTSPSRKNIYAGTMIHYEGEPVAYHFDAAGSEPMFNEGSRESVWWLPNDTTDAHLIIANAGAKPVEAVVSLFAQSGKAYSRHVSLAARQMARLGIRELVTAAGFTDTYGGLRVTVAQGAESVFVSHLAFDLATGFSALLRVFEDSPEEDPHDLTLRAPMLALSNPDPVLSLPQGTILQPKVFLRNTKGSPLTVKGELRWRSASTQGVLRLPDAALNANETRIVDLSAMQQDGTIPKDASWGYLKLNYSGRYGDLVAIVASYDASLTHGLQTPFSDIVASHWVGSKWYADDVRNSLVTAGNGGDKPTNVLFTLYYNGGKSKYEIQQSLAPGEQMFVNAAKIIGSQAPDRNGSTIPPGVQYGSYSIRNLDDPLGTYLFEGKLTIDTKFGNAFYGCGNCCNPAGPPGKVPDPFSQLVGDVWANTLWGYDVCDDNTYDVTAHAYGWWSSDTSVMTVDSGGWTTGVGAGSPSLNSTLYIPNQSYKCPYRFFYPQSSGTVSADRFNVAYSDYIPVDHVDGPTSCTYQSSSFTKIYMGDGNRGTYRTTESIFITPDSQQSTGFAQDTGQTRNYGAHSPANGSTLSAADEDNVALDCLLWNDVGKATPAFSHSESYPSANHGQVHFWGSAANPLEDQSATINWDMTVLLDDTNPSFPTAITTFTHTCYPAHQIKVNGGLAYIYTPPENDILFIFNCLFLHIGTVSGSYGPVPVNRN